MELLLAIILSLKIVGVSIMLSILIVYGINKAPKITFVLVIIALFIITVFRFL